MKWDIITLFREIELLILSKAILANQKSEILFSTNYPFLWSQYLSVMATLIPFP
jgi:hypothetical protein